MTTTLLAYPTFEANDDFKVFTERLENAFFINKTSPADRVPILLNQIDASVYKTLRSLCDPEPLADKSFEDLCALLRRQYVRELSVWKARQQFFQAFEVENEGVNNWYLRLKTLAADCGFGETLDAVICYKFVAGLELSEAFDKIAEHGTTLTMDELLAVAMSFEDELAIENYVESTSDEDENYDEDEIECEEYEDEEEYVDQEEEEEQNEYEDEEENEDEYENDDEDEDDVQEEEEEEVEDEEENVVALATNQNQGQRYYRGNPRPLQLCFYCGEVNHDFSTCVHKTSYCNFCHELGHLEKVCRHVRPDVRSEIDEKLAKVSTAPGNLEKCVECNTFDHSFALCPKRSCNPFGQKPTVGQQPPPPAFYSAQSAPRMHQAQPAPRQGYLEKCTECNTIGHSFAVCPKRSYNPFGQMGPMGNTYPAFPTVCQQPPPQQFIYLTQSAPKMYPAQSAPALRVRRVRPASAPKVRQAQAGPKVRPARPPSAPKVRPAQPSSAPKVRPAKPPSAPKSQASSAVKVRPVQARSAVKMRPAQTTSQATLTAQQYQACLSMLVNVSVQSATAIKTGAIKKTGPSTITVKTGVRKITGTSTNTVKTGVKKQSGTSTNTVKTGVKKQSGTATKTSKVQSKPKKK